jgi:hypothetical protein
MKTRVSHLRVASFLLPHQLQSSKHPATRNLIYKRQLTKAIAPCLAMSSSIWRIYSHDLSNKDAVTEVSIELRMRIWQWKSMWKRTSIKEPRKRYRWIAICLILVLQISIHIGRWARIDYWLLISKPRYQWKNRFVTQHLKLKHQGTRK